MPIRPATRARYPFDWKLLSAAVRFRRAGGQCESCGRPHGRAVYHLGDGRWFDDARGTWRDGRGRPLPQLSADQTKARATRVVLACAHLDHDPGNNAGRNLKALCQRCHLLNDREEHGRRRRTTYRLRWALGDLFLGPYRA